MTEESAHTVKLAEVIDVHQVLTGEGRTQAAVITIDGERFPWYVTEDVSVQVSQDTVPTITLTLLANRVTVSNAITTNPQG